MPVTNMRIARSILMVLIGMYMLDKVWYVIKHAKKEEIILCIETFGLSLVWACMLCFLIRYGLTGFLKKISILGVLFVWVLLLIGGILVIKKVILKNRVNGLISISFQQIVNGVAFGILALRGNMEYAVVLLSIAMLVTIIMQYLFGKFRRIGIIINGVYIVLHSFVVIAVFNVFLRGVNIEQFLLVQLISLFVFLTMNVFVFGRNR